MYCVAVVYLWSLFSFVSCLCLLTILYTLVDFPNLFLLSPPFLTEKNEKEEYYEYNMQQYEKQKQKEQHALAYQQLQDQQQQLQQRQEQRRQELEQEQLNNEAMLMSTAAFHPDDYDDSTSPSCSRCFSSIDFQPPNPRQNHFSPDSYTHTILSTFLSL